MIMQLAHELRSNMQREIAPRELRKFGLLIGAILVLVGAYPPRTIAPVRLFPGVVLILLAIFWPASLRMPYRAWMGIGITLGFFVSRILLVAFYYCVIFPVGFAMHVFGHDPMGTRIDTNKKTYWIKHSNG